MSQIHIVRRPYLLAHRGASGYAPENTFTAFDRAVAQRADGIETDVRATRDGVLVLMHDERVDRTTQGEGRVADLEYSAIQRLDAAYGHPGRVEAEAVPTLEEFLARFGGRVGICLEIKQSGIESAVVEMVRSRGLLAPRPRQSAAPRGKAVLPPVSFTSFDLQSAAAVARLAPGSLVGHLTPEFDDAAIGRAIAQGLNQICPPANLCTPARVQGARERDLSIRAWQVRNREALRTAVLALVDGVTCDWPDWTLDANK